MSGRISSSNRKKQHWQQQQQLAEEKKKLHNIGIYLPVPIANNVGRLSSFRTRVHLQKQTLALCAEYKELAANKRKGKGEGAVIRAGGARGGEGGGGKRR